MVRMPRIEKSESLGDEKFAEGLRLFVEARTRADASRISLDGLKLLASSLMLDIKIPDVRKFRRDECPGCGQSKCPESRLCRDCRIRLVSNPLRTRKKDQNRRAISLSDLRRPSQEAKEVIDQTEAQQVGEEDEN